MFVQCAHTMPRPKRAMEQEPTQDSATAARSAAENEAMFLATRKVSRGLWMFVRDGILKLHPDEGMRGDDWTREAVNDILIAVFR